MNHYTVISLCASAFRLLRAIYTDDNSDRVLGVKAITLGLSPLYLYRMEFIYYSDTCVFSPIHVLSWFTAVVVLSVKR